MIRRHHAPRFGGGEASIDEVDPRVGLVNLADIMLVLAVALMLSIMTRVGYAAINAVQIDADSLEALDAEEITTTIDEDAFSDEEIYEEIGSVYRNAETGDLYVVQTP